MGTSTNKDNLAPSPQVVVEFLAGTLPFNDLPSEELERIARRVRLDFFPKGTLIFEQDKTVVEDLFLIQKGGVKIYLKDEEGEITLKDFRGEGAYIGALPIIQGTTANLNVETVEDTFCFLLDKETFVELISNYPKFAQYYLKSFSEKFIRTAYRELRHHRVAPKTEGTLYMFSIRVGDLIKKEPVVARGSETIQQAAARMAELHIGSLLIQDPSGEIVGIVTDKDLRTKVVAKGLGLDTQVEKIMTSPVSTIPAKAVCFDALLTMMKDQIHHLAVEDEEQIIGIVTAHDIMVLQGTSPIYLFREIMAQRTIEGLYPLSQKIPLVVGTLIEEGAKANNITRMITVLNDHILEKLLTLLQEQLGPAPLPFCWMLMGSEGRKEQTFRTDQDNAILYQDAEDPSLEQRAAEYFERFGKEAIEHLVNCGYPRCPGDIMASNPRWRQPYKGWVRHFDHWIDAPEPKEVLHASIFFDFRAGYGESAMADHLRQHITERTKRQQIYLLHMANDYLGNRPPLSFFRNFIVEKNGEHKNKLDIKRKGLMPLINFARILSLKNGITETNTISRLQALADGGFISQELSSTAQDAYELQMQMRFIHQLRQMEQGEQPDNYIDPGQLSDLEKQMLKDAFAVIERLQGVLRTIFPVV